MDARYSKELRIGTARISVWTPEESDGSSNQVCVSFRSGTPEVITSIIVLINDERELDSLVQALNAASGHAWPQEF